MDGAKRTQFWCWIEKQQRCTKIVVEEKKQSNSIWNKENTDLWPQTQSSASKEKISIGLFLVWMIFLRSLLWPAMDIFNMYKVRQKIKHFETKWSQTWSSGFSGAEFNSAKRFRVQDWAWVFPCKVRMFSDFHPQHSCIRWLKMLKGPIQHVFLQGQFPAYHVTLRVTRKEKD